MEPARLETKGRISVVQGKALFRGCWILYWILCWMLNAECRGHLGGISRQKWFVVYST
jgi:hypothetical protein